MSGEVTSAVEWPFAPPLCGAQLHHTHGTALCDLRLGHDGQHGAWCDSCYENEYTDPSDRLSWDADGEDWVTRGPV